MKHSYSWNRDELRHLLLRKRNSTKPKMINHFAFQRQVPLGIFLFYYFCFGKKITDQICCLDWYLPGDDFAYKNA